MGTKKWAALKAERAVQGLLLLNAKSLKFRIARCQNTCVRYGSILGAKMRLLFGQGNPVFQGYLSAEEEEESKLEFDESRWQQPCSGMSISGPIKTSSGLESLLAFRGSSDELIAERILLIILKI